jgi:hypothetical protein
MKLHNVLLPIIILAMTDATFAFVSQKQNIKVVQDHYDRVDEHLRGSGRPGELGWAVYPL